MRIVRIFKKSQEKLPDYYNKKTAQDPDTSPEILTKILRMNNDDRISEYAALHPNTPPEILVEVLAKHRQLPY